MNMRLALALAAVVVPALPAMAGEMMNPQQAHQFVSGKYFAYNCFEGTSGHGRIQSDGSVAGFIRIKGKGPSRFVQLPPGTIKVSSNAICAAVRGLPMQPCFNVEQIDNNSFRGSVSGLGFAYCTFTRRNPRLMVAEASEEVLTSRAAGSFRRRAVAIKSAEMSIDAPEAAEVGKVEKQELPPAQAPVQASAQAPAQSPAPEELKLRPSKSE